MKRPRHSIIRELTLVTLDLQLPKFPDGRGYVTCLVRDAPGLGEVLPRAGNLEPGVAHVPPLP